MFFLYFNFANAMRNLANVACFGHYTAFYGLICVHRSLMSTFEFAELLCIRHACGNTFKTTISTTKTTPNHFCKTSSILQRQKKSNYIQQQYHVWISIIVYCILLCYQILTTTATENLFSLMTMILSFGKLSKRLLCHNLMHNTNNNKKNTQKRQKLR